MKKACVEVSVLINSLAASSLSSELVSGASKNARAFAPRSPSRVLSRAEYFSKPLPRGTPRLYVNVCSELIPPSKPVKDRSVNILVARPATEKRLNFLAFPRTMTTRSRDN